MPIFVRKCQCRCAYYCGPQTLFWAISIELHQSTAASTWWCGPRPRLGWVEMAVDLPEGPSYPGYFPSFFRYVAPRTTAEGQHTASSKSVACFSLFSCPSSSSLVDERQRSSEPWPHLFLLSVRWKCDLAGQVSAMLCLLQIAPPKVLTTFPLQIQSSWQLSLLELLPCCVLTRNTVIPSSSSSDIYTSTVQPGPLC